MFFIHINFESQRFDFKPFSLVIFHDHYLLKRTNHFRHEEFLKLKIMITYNIYLQFFKCFYIVVLNFLCYDIFEFMCKITKYHIRRL